MSTKLTGNIKAVYEMLPRGCKAPITASRISSRLNIPKRDVYGIINTLVMSCDIPVGGLRSDKHGYFIITNEDERRMAINPLEHHATEIMARVEKIKGINLAADEN